MAVFCDAEEIFMADIIEVKSYSSEL